MRSGDPDLLEERSRSRVPLLSRANGVPGRWKLSDAWACPKDLFDPHTAAVIGRIRRTSRLAIRTTRAGC